MRYRLTMACLLVVASLYGQQRYQGGLLPALNLSHSFGSDWKINMKIESRQQFFRGGIDRLSGWEYENVLTDVAFVLGRKIQLNKTLAGGYMTRFRDGELIHRFIQQFSVVQRSNGWRLGHRFSADQTFADGEAGTYRLRYRITTQRALQGESIDPREFYLKINTEVLNEWQGGDYHLEFRFVPFIGYEVNDNNKIEVGIDYRLSSFLDGGRDQRFWTSLTWYLAM